MAEEIAALGDISNGAALAGVVEPSTGGGTASGTGVCLNCGTGLIDVYCQRCGQKVDVHRTLSAFWHDLVHSIFHFDGKIWRTLPMLFLRPGELTRRYIHGERAKFVSPLALFLFCLFLLFAAFNTIGGPFTLKSTTTVNGATVTPETIAAELRGQREKLKRLEAQAERDPRPELVALIADQRNAVKSLKTAQRLSDGIDVEDIATEGGARVAGSGWLSTRLKKATRNPALLNYKLQSSAYKFGWLIIPLSVPFVWLMFFRQREFKLYDHAVFVTYSLCFAGLWMILLSVLKIVLPWQITNTALLLGMIVHFYIQVKGAYGLTQSEAVVRTFGLVISSSIVLAIFGILLLAMDVLA